MVISRTAKNQRPGGIIVSIVRVTRFALLCLAFIAPATAFAAAPELPAMWGIPVDFILFALTLLGVALFHHYTLYVALIGLATITLYKILFTGFKTGPGVSGFVSLLGHEWVILTNLLCLL